MSDITDHLRAAANSTGKSRRLDSDTLRLAADGIDRLRAECLRLGNESEELRGRLAAMNSESEAWVRIIKALRTEIDALTDLPALDARSDADSPDQIGQGR